MTVFTAFMGLIHMVRSHPISRVRAPGAEVNVLLTQDNRAYIPGHHGGMTGDLMRLVLNGAVRYHLLAGSSDGDVTGGPDYAETQSFRLYQAATGPG